MNVRIVKLFRESYLKRSSRLRERVEWIAFVQVIIPPVANLNDLTKRLPSVWEAQLSGDALPHWEARGAPPEDASD